MENSKKVVNRSGDYKPLPRSQPMIILMIFYSGRLKSLKSGVRNPRTKIVASLIITPTLRKSAPERAGVVINFTPRFVAQKMRKGGLFGNPPQDGGVHKRPKAHARAIVIDAKGDAPAERNKRVRAV
jgi:hypothetical protein